MAGAPPLYGTCVYSIFVMDLNSSAAMCMADPLPADP